MRGGTRAPPVTDNSLMLILVQVVAIALVCPLFLPEFTLIVLNLRLIALQGATGLLRLLSLTPVGVPIPRPARLVHFLALFLELVPVPAPSRPPLFYFLALALNRPLVLQHPAR